MKFSSLDCDLCVIGGGLSGVCAAVSAARRGSRVVLVQDRPVLGGNASSEIRMHVVGADCHGTRPGARETGLLEEFRLDDAVRNPHRSYSQWDILLYEKVTLEPNITLLLNATCDGCETFAENGVKMIRSAHVTRPSTEEAFVITAKFFADCSGDGRLGLEAGADFLRGRESKATFGESLACDAADEQTLGSSILITSRRYNTPQPFIAPSWIRKFERGDFVHRPIGSWEYGFWWAEWGGQLDTIADNEKIRHELYRIALGIWDYIKNSGEYPESANWALDWVGALPGKRESRRFVGPHVLTEQDIMSGRTFEDDVAYGGWWLDLHPPSGVDAVDEPPCVQHHIPHLYGIPLRCLHSRNVGNLFFSGRNISATHVAFASTRVMGTCAVMGQAVGTAASLLAPGDIAAQSTPEKLFEIQQALLKDDAFLPGVANADLLDLARKAEVFASTNESAAAAVVNGLGRPIHGNWGPWATEAGNGWTAGELPAWLELRWIEPWKISEVHLTFCTGLQRELTLSPSDRVTAQMVRGPQPETVRDYDLCVDGRVVAEVRGNYQRKRRHKLPEGLRADRVRVRVLATQGAPEAVISEIRVY